MKKHFAVIAIAVITSVAAFGQEKKNETYKFLNANEVQNVGKHKTALSTANMTKFRYKDQRNIIVFKSGLKVELFSANELTANGYTVDERRLLTAEPINIGMYTLSISADGKTIMQKFTKSKIK